MALTPRATKGSQLTIAELDAVFNGLDARITASQATADAALPTASTSVYGRSLIDDADAATARATLGLGTAATQASTAFDAAGSAAAAQAASQPLQAVLTAIAALATTGILAITAAGTVACRTITGTTNQVTVTNGDGVAGNPTLSLPQSIHTAATPTFAGLTLSTTPLAATSGGTGLNALGTANQLLGINAGATAAEYKTISGTSNRITVTHGVGTITLDGPQDIHTAASPTFAGLTISGLTSGRVPFATTAGLLTDSANLTYASGTFKVNDSTASTSTTTGALVVTGGVGIGGAVFTNSTLQCNGVLTVNSAGNHVIGVAAGGAINILFRAAAGNGRGLIFQTGGSNRWSLVCDNSAETGSDAGSAIVLTAYNDAAGTIDSPLSIIRAAGGAITLARPTTWADAKNLAFGTTTGTKIGTATTQKIGFWNSAPAVQPAAQADASGGSVIDTEARTAINGLLAKLRTIGLIAA